MISPENWFTLYVLARNGAVHQNVTITTRELGEVLGVSQQTASRRVTHCVEEGYIARVHTANGMRIQMTDRGSDELLKVLSGLETAFMPPEDEIVIEGAIVDGIGEGAYYVDVYSEMFHNALGFEPYPGTLNVRIQDEKSRKAFNKMKHSPPLIVQGFSHEGRTFGDVICYRVKVNRKIEAAVVIAQRTHHSSDILEIIAPFNIRKRLSLKTGDIISLAYIPLHLAV